MLIALQAKPAQLLFNASAIQSLLQGTCVWPNFAYG